MIKITFAKYNRDICLNIRRMGAGIEPVLCQACNSLLMDVMRIVEISLLQALLLCPPRLGVHRHPHPRSQVTRQLDVSTECLALLRMRIGRFVMTRGWAGN